MDGEDKVTLAAKPQTQGSMTYTQLSRLFKQTKEGKDEMIQSYFNTDTLYMVPVKEKIWVANLGYEDLKL